MFFGTTPAIISQWIKRVIEKEKPANVFVPFAGNFVIEQVCALVNKEIRVQSSDVSLYSVAIGEYLNGESVLISLTDETLRRFPSLSKYPPHEANAIASLLLGEVSKAETKPHIPYYRNMVLDAERNNEKYCAAISLKLRRFKDALGNLRFHATDGVNLVDMAQAGDLVFYDPPVLLGDYEKMFKELAKFFKFDEPSYTQMTEEVKMKNIEDLIGRGCTVYYRRNDPDFVFKGLHKAFLYQYKYHASYCVYTNSSKSQWVGRWHPIKDKPAKLDVIRKEHDITEKSVVRVEAVEKGVVNHYRLLWVKKAEMADAGRSYVIFVDNRVVGCVSLMSGSAFGHDMAVIMSDPCAPTSKYKRLSKLILYVVCTEEMLNLFNKNDMWMHTSFTTRVFTNEMVSMTSKGIALEVAQETDVTHKKGLDDLNEKLVASGMLPLELVSPKDCIGADVNARYFDPETFQLLVNNVKTDGRLESVPLVYKDPLLKPNQFRIVSDHHRIDAAKTAGLEYILVMVLDTDDVDKIVSKQLAHNAIVGKDDEVILAQLFESIKDLEMRFATGLNDKIGKISYPTLNFKVGTYQEMMLLFVPEDVEKWDAVINDLTVKMDTEVRVSPLADYDAFVKALIKVKRKENIKSNGTAIARIIEIIEEWIQKN